MYVRSRLWRIRSREPQQQSTQAIHVRLFGETGKASHRSGHQWRLSVSWSGRKVAHIGLEFFDPMQRALIHFSLFASSLHIPSISINGNCVLWREKKMGMIGMTPFVLFSSIASYHISIITDLRWIVHSHFCPCFLLDWTTSQYTSVVTRDQHRLVAS